jgi:ABC-type Fe3+/spermidine/putrescine transport system ATPase subunit
MDLGRVMQVGTPHEVYERPRSRFVADFIGIANILPLGDGRWLALRPEKIALSAARPDTAHAIAGRIVDVAYEGDRSLYRVATDEGRALLVSTANIARTAETFRRGQSVWLGWAADAGHELGE